MRRHPFAPLSLALLAVAFAAAGAVAEPFQFPMPNGETESRDARDVAPYLAAWKARVAGRAAAAHQPMTANQQQYDVRWHDLNLTFTTGTNQVSGTVRTKGTVVAGPISVVELDLYANMVVDGATSAGGATTTSRAGNLLTVNLERAYNTGETFDITVTYHGAPSGSGYFGFSSVQARTLIWSLSEAYGARTWWPCKDAPEDKADSVDVHFTVPSSMTAVSNGTLTGTTNNGATITYHWKERYPIATYLVSIAAYAYSIVDDWYKPTPTDSMLIRFHIVPESVGNAATVDAKVKDMIAAYASRMGEYPFLAEKYGHAEFPFSGGMEHQTCTSLGVYNESVIAHELMHQWWGDLVTCRDFAHIWLNEGFATYGEALWQEAIGGMSAYHADMNFNRYLGAGTVWVPDPLNESRVFDSNLSYNKGSWVLHMLRHVLGDDTFFEALRHYRDVWGYKSATTEDFRDAVEAVAGRDLDAFFQQWVYGEYYPTYQYSWTSAPSGGGYDVTLTLQQIQAWQLFNMPVDVTITTASSETTFVVPDSLASQTFVLHVAASPTGVQIDKDGWILKSVKTVVSNPSFERSVLLVNGVDWSNYGTEITSAYTDKAFWGNYAVDFWDNFDTPAGGYPATLPAPLGHGAVPGDVLGHYRNVIWIGNNFNGDLASWQDTPALSYLQAGGNLFLLTRQGESFLDTPLRQYLGINWASTGVTLNDCITTRPGLTNIGRISTQSLCAVFDTNRTTPESQLLWRVSLGFTPSRGIGAIRIPPNGAGFRPHGGRFAFLSGRPYRWDHTLLKNNIQTILGSWFLEPVNLLAADSGELAARLSFEAVAPNPSSRGAALRFSLPRAGRARLVVLDVAGRAVRTLVDGSMSAGPHEADWDGRDGAGALAAPGLYFARLDADGEHAVRRIVRVR